jgi:hypothetical protein
MKMPLEDLRSTEEEHEWKSMFTVSPQLFGSETHEFDTSSLNDALEVMFERLRSIRHAPQSGALVHDFPVEPAEARFRRLADEWYEESAHMASPAEMAMLPSYQQIIGIGLPAVPLILDELQESPDHWFWALTAITGENPVTAASQGRVELMAQTWIEWGRHHGFID